MKIDYAALTARVNLPKGTTVCVWDKDSTIANTAHRHHLLPQIKAGTATWAQYATAAADDTPLTGAVRLMRMLPYPHIVVTGANESARDVIEAWGRKHAIPWHALILRPDAWHAPNATYKAGVVAALQAAGLEVTLCLEDYPKAAAAIEKLGVPVLGVNPFYAETPHPQPANPEHGADSSWEEEKNESPD